MEGVSGAEGAEDTQDGGTSSPSGTFSPGLGETWVLRRKRENINKEQGELKIKEVADDEGKG